MRSFALLLVGVVALDAHGVATLDEDEHDDVREEDEEQSLGEVSATEQAEIASLQKKMDAQIAAIAATHAEIERVQAELMDNTRCCMDFDPKFNSGNCPSLMDYYLKQGTVADGNLQVTAADTVTLNGVCCEKASTKYSNKVLFGLKELRRKEHEKTARCEPLANDPIIKNAFKAAEKTWDPDTAVQPLDKTNLIYDAKLNARLDAAKPATIVVAEGGDQDRDCDGSWSACTSACEAAGGRTWTETAAHSGSGAACPTATDCQPGDGDCPRPEGGF